MIGANGAGKTTWCARNRDQLPASFYDADSIAQGLGSFDDSDLQRAARDLIDRRIQTHLTALETFGFESTYSGKSRPDIVRRAHALGYDVRAVFIGTLHPDINIERVEARVRSRTGHYVAEQEIRRRWTAARDNLIATWADLDTVEILDNSGRDAYLLGFKGRRITRWAAVLPEWAVRIQGQAPGAANDGT